MEVDQEDALVRKSSMSFRKKNDSMLQETETDGKACKKGTGIVDPEIAVGEIEKPSRSSTATVQSPLKTKLEPSAYYDKVQGVWKCHHCSWVCPVLKPGVELLDNHKQHCQRMKNTQALVRQGFTLEHEIQECSRANLCLANGGGEIENEDTNLLEDKTMPILLEKKTGMLEKSVSTGNVEEEVVRVLKEQQSHDILCPVCGSCITERVILRKRKRTSLVFGEKRHKDNALSEVDPVQGSGYQNDQPETPNEVEEEIYGCLSCFSFFIRRVEECFGTGTRGINTSATNMSSVGNVGGTDEKDIVTAVTNVTQYPVGIGPSSQVNDSAFRLLEPKIQDEKIENNYKNDSLAKLNGTNKGSDLCNCIPVSFQSIWLAWLSKKIPEDEQSRDPLLSKKPLDKGPSLTDGHNTIINVHPNVELGGPPREPVSDLLDILKSIVYGGLNVSVTSFGVVSSAAGGEAKTLTVIAIGLANLVAGLSVLLNSIMDPQNREAIGERWFNRCVALFSYIIFGCLAPITYGFSFHKTDDRNYKFLTTSAVALVSIVMLALGKARVTSTGYCTTVSRYVIVGFWASIIGYLSGEYIHKLLQNWGFKTDGGNTHPLPHSY